MKQNNKYCIVAIGGDLNVYPYLAKLKSILDSLGDVSEITWNRGEVGKEKNSFFTYKIGSKIGLIFGYMLWVIKLTFLFCKNKDFDKVYFCSRLDCALPAFIANLIGNKVRYVYLDRDAYHLTYNFGLLTKLVKKIEMAVAKKSVKHFVPGQSRNFTKLDNVCVIENTPTKAFFDEAKYLSVTHHRNDKFVIYVNGWLVNTRGADTILETIKLLDSAKFRVIVAGPSECAAISDLISLEIVEYLGQLSNVQALSYYFISDVVLCFYDPSIEVNRKAEPNKWFDCAFTGTPFITNKGISTFDAFKGKGPVYAIEYGISSELFNLLNELSSSRTGSKYRPYFEALNVDYWDVKVERIIQKLNKKKVV